MNSDGANKDSSAKAARNSSGKTFPKSLRLLNARDYQAVFNDAQFKASHPQLLILARPNGSEHPRLGLVIAKKHIRLAVQRNRIKRILRETFRLRQHLLAGIDVIVLARPGLGELDNPALQQLLDKQWRRLRKKAGLVEPPPT